MQPTDLVTESSNPFSDLSLVTQLYSYPTDTKAKLVTKSKNSKIE